jgi:ankyrin repeat protein
LGPALSSGDFDFKSFTADASQSLSPPNTSIFTALDKGYDAVLSQLLERGVPVDLRDPTGLTLLCRAVGLKAADNMVSLLLRKGAQINATCGNTTDSHSTALDFAVSSDNAKAVGALIEAAIAKQVPLDLHNALMVAANSGYEDVVRQLLRTNVEVDVPVTAITKDCHVLALLVNHIRDPILRAANSKNSYCH